MTDLNKTIMEKAHGTLKLDPDQQRKFLETFEERVIGTCNLPEASSPAFLEHFQEILQKLLSDYQPIFVKISPNLETKSQLTYMKIAQELGCKTTIVSADCQCSPFGLVLHTDHPVHVEEKDLLKQFASILTPSGSTAPQPEKKSFWKKLFG